MPIEVIANSIKATEIPQNPQNHLEEILADSRRKQRGIYRKRVESYYNSRLHFCRSLYNNKLQENGYLFSRVCFDQEEEDLD